MENQYQEAYSQAKETPSVFQTIKERREKWAPLLDKNFDRKWRDKCFTEAQFEVMKNAVEIALECQVEQLSKRKEHGGIGMPSLKRMPVKQLMESISSASDIAPHARLSLGIVMYAMPKLYIESLFGVQPMALPLAPIFYLQKTYEDAKAPDAAGGRLDVIAQRNETYSGGRYFDEVGTGDGVTTTFNLDDGETKSHEIYFDGVLVTPTFAINVGAGPGNVDQIDFTAAPALNVDIVVSYTGYEEADTPRRIKMQLTSKDVRAEDSTLRYQTTIQAMQDLQSYHGMDLDEIMTMVLAEELLAEFEANALRRVFKFAGAGTVPFDTAGYLPGDTSSADRREYDRGIYKAITVAANLIYTLKGTNPNWIVGGVDAVGKLEELMDFEHIKSSDDPMVSEVQHRVQVGVLTGSGGYRVYKDARMPGDELLLGYKGMLPFDAGYIICPHTMYVSDVIPDPSANMTFARGMMYRAGQVFADERQYAKIKLL